MIVKRNFNPIRVWEYIQRPMLLGILWPMIVWVIYYFSNRPEMALNFTPVGVLGSALAIFVAFRNNSAYNRWWEARTLWGGIVNSSRVLSRLIITFTDSHSHQPQFDRERSDIFKKTMIYLCIAWAHALRLHLRKQESWDELKPYIPESDRTALVKCQHKPNFIMMSMGKRIYEAMANGTLGGFDSFQMEGQMLALCNYQGSCERIKDTPLPRQYDFFTRLFVVIFTLLLPFGLLSFFQSGNLVFFSWLIIPLSILISGVFVIMERTGAANENPFENLITDIPMTAICNNIERDLLEMLGENPFLRKPSLSKVICSNKMKQEKLITTQRLEAFSDGFLAIIITIMVFDLKPDNLPEGQSVWFLLKLLIPRFVSYIISFLMLAVMWVNHHQLFHQVRHTDRKLLWFNINLLFWMSLIPFGTHFIGMNPMIWQASFLYGVIFLMCAVSFTLIRDHILKAGLLSENISRSSQDKVRIKNRLAITIYFLSVLSSMVSVYLSFILFLIVPFMYCIPENILHEKMDENQ